MKTKPWNAFDYLDTQEEIVAYLQDCFDDENPRIFINALGDLAKKHGMSDLAEAIDVNRESLYKSFNGKVSPRYDTIAKVVSALGMKLTVSV